MDEAEFWDRLECRITREFAVLVTGGVARGLGLLSGDHARRAGDRTTLWITAGVLICCLIVGLTLALRRRRTSRTHRPAPPEAEPM